MYATSLALTVLLILTTVSTPTAAAKKVPKAPLKPARTDTLVLGTRSWWRVFVMLRPTLFGTRDNAKENIRGRLAGRGWSRRRPVLPEGRPHTPPPPAGWTSQDFDDSRWWRDPGPFFGGAAWRYEQRARPHYARYGWMSQPISLALICARGKFSITDPARIKSLKLSAEFRGGAVAYINGREIGRVGITQGDVTPETLAEDYPKEAHVGDNGYPLYYWNEPSVQRKEKYRPLKERAELRVRKFQDIEVPVANLEKGINVLAIEVHRAVLDDSALKGKRGAKGDTRWNTCGLMNVWLRAEGDGIVANAGRPKGVQVWNSNPIESVFDSDYGDPNEPLRPIRIVAARNASFSGQVVVGSDKPIKGINAAVGKLEHEGGGTSLPAPRIRYPRADVVEGGGKTFPGEGCPVATYRFDSLHDLPPAEVPVKSLRHGSWRKLTPEQAPWVGAVQTIWLTVHVPDRTLPGNYRGELTITLEGSGPVKVPVEIKVHDFRIPDPEKLRTWVDFVEAPDNLSVRYNVGLWTEEHWKLVEESMKFLAEVRNKTLYIPLICRTNHNNEQSMVCWVRKADGTYEYDLSPMERYIDLALSAGLAPEAIIFQVWDYHIGRDPKWKIGTGMYGQTTVNEPQPIPVTSMDPSTGKPDELLGPKYVDAEIEAFWRPVAGKITKSMKERGLGKTMMLGLSGDYVPPRECVLLWAKFWPGVPWAAVAHGGAKDFYGVPLSYGVSVLWRKFAVDPEIQRNYGWKNPNNHALFDRYKGGRHAQIAFDRIAAEISLISYLRGPGRLALDSFVWRSRYASTRWGSISLPRPLLAAGDEGPVSTCRFEMLREGVQECEARIAVEEALTDEALKAKLGAKRAAEYQEILDERTRRIIWSDETNTNGKNHSSLPLGPLGFDWYAGSDWEGRLDALFSAAAVCQKLK